MVKLSFRVDVTVLLVLEHGVLGVNVVPSRGEHSIVSLRMFAALTTLKGESIGVYYCLVVCTALSKQPLSTEEYGKTSLQWCVG